jgi:predicted DNA-binding transcriptional regulator YafY
VLSQHAAGLSIAEMARHTSVNDRTIRRDLKLFVDAGIPLRETIGARSKKVWRIEQRGTMVTVSNSGDEALALIVAEKLFEPLKGTQFYLAIKRCRDQFTAALSTANRARLEQQSKNLHIDLQHSADMLANSAMIDEMWQALAACEPVGISWRGALSYSRQPAASQL